MRPPWDWREETDATASHACVSVWLASGPTGDATARETRVLERRNPEARWHHFRRESCMAMAKEAAAHRAGALKQQNKPHKAGRHRVSSARRQGGRVPVKTLTRQVQRNWSKQDRRHRAWQLRRQHQQAVLEEKRNLGRRDGPPHLVVLVPLHAQIDPHAALNIFQSNQDSVVFPAKGGPPGFALLCPQSKLRWRFIVADAGSLHAVLDLAKVADTLLFMLDAADGWDAVGDRCLSCIFAQGLPSYGLAVQGLAELMPKKQTDYRKKLSKVIEKRFPGAKLFSLDTEQESALLLQHLASQKQQHLAFRDRRAHLLADAAKFVPSSDSGLVGTLKVSGYVRGRSLNVNSLVHIVGHGDFQMNQVDAPPDLFALNLKCPGGQLASRKKQGDLSSSVTEMEEEVKVLSKADPAKQQSLQSEVVPDPMEGEQTWPSEEELREADESLKQSKKAVRRVPEGTSAYQAAWILDGDEWRNGSEEEEEEIVEEAMAQDGSSSAEEIASEEEEEDCETMTLPETEQAEEKMEEEEAMLEKYRQEREEEMFPDEVDTPRDVPARVRFQKFRGLKSFRTSPWDPKEKLPRDYARIFQFQDFSRTRKDLFRQVEKEETDGAQVGWYVTIHLCNVPVSVMESFQQKQEPLVLFTLLPHEQKMSVLNLLVRRHPGYSEPVKSKEDVIIHCGFRRFLASPLYSRHTSVDKHKLEKFFHADTAVVATIYAPITFPPASVLLFKQESDGAQNLLATGSLLSVDPNRLVIKRAVLSGHPFKIFSKLAVVRYMFFNREDVLWFKPVELRTKWGRRGHIKEPLGTHGHMKCQFDGQLKSQDTVLMTLYKRVFPRWTFDPRVPEPTKWRDGTRPRLEGEEKMD
ncbi:pre-rRNA-processing protein TSR1 homolog isoform X1 [Crotalus tigris]|uniref:pre-rRNA-processing protein TSR1 homolog isoform X1 n=1 Tax=Crotalus tigris TaxID=88082 RepID=UPI00192FA413|nr:pre-rRNA-processing protein TSR1 homolog isoform X1 [Crotalus tigris]